MAGLGDSDGAVWFCEVITALPVLFTAGPRVPIPAIGLSRWLTRSAVVGAAVAVTICANTAQSASRGPYRRQQSALANELGVQVYNTAVAPAGDRRIQVITTNEKDIALAILRALRARETVICFGTGHGEYDIDNFEFHTHFEGVQSHGHNIEGVGFIQMKRHGPERLRRTIEKLGLVSRKTLIERGPEILPDGAALVKASPRTHYTGPDFNVYPLIWSMAGAG
jgi:hypothetical protein